MDGRHIFLQWRAGQLSGRTRPQPLNRGALLHLQWRAGQSSGRTGIYGLRADGRMLPSMEGPTIVRPNMQAGRWAAPSMVILQWRAGELSGQTARLAWWLRPASSAAGCERLWETRSLRRSIFPCQGAICLVPQGCDRRDVDAISKPDDSTHRLNHAAIPREAVRTSRNLPASFARSATAGRS